MARAPRKVKAKQTLKNVARLLLGGLVLEDPDEFKAVATTIRESAKASSGIAGLLFAGSLTFLGLSGKLASIQEDSLLKYSWILLMGTVLLQVVVYLISISASLHHDRIDRRTKADKDKFGELVGIVGVPQWFMDAWRRFSTVATLLISALIFQVLLLIAGTILMMLFILANI